MKTDCSSRFPPPPGMGVAEAGGKCEPRTRGLKGRERWRRREDEGYILLVLLLMVALIMIALAVAAPSLATQVKRDREEETIHRGTQYARAIKRFYKKFGRYPARMEELEKTNNLRFLRRRYQDPMTAEGKWRIIHFGEAKTTPTGLFGAPAGVAGANPAAAAAAMAASGKTLGGGSSGTLFSLSLPSSSSSQNPPGTSGNAQSASNPGTPVAQMGTLQPGGATFGGGAIVGVASTSEKSSLKELNGKSHYNEWEFVYDPRLDLANQAGLAGGTAAKPGTGSQQPQNQPSGQQPTGPMSPGPMPGVKTQ